jgi:hypothetical protein
MKRADQPPEPTAVGAYRAAVPVPVASRRRAEAVSNGNCKLGGETLRWV